MHLYPEPKHDKLIEPFAGSARYALKYWERDVILCDQNPTVINLWKFLQTCSKTDLDGLPILKQGDKLSDYNLSNDERNFLGFVVSEGVSSPRNTVTKRASSKVRHKIKATIQVLDKIKHWHLVCGDYRSLKNDTATWFIDPPYENGGEHYPFGNDLDYEALGCWVEGRRGQVIACENNNANWLPFTRLKEHWGGSKRSTEMIYLQENE